MRIQIVGLPGSGKTTLAKKIADHFGYQYIAERYKDNPFLSEAWRLIQTTKEDSYPPEIVYSQQWFLSQYITHVRTKSDNIVQDAGAVMGCVYTMALADIGLVHPEVAKSMIRAYYGLFGPQDIIINIEMSTVDLLKRRSLRGRNFEELLDKERVAAFYTASEENLTHMVLPDALSTSGARYIGVSPHVDVEESRLFEKVLGMIVKRPGDLKW